MPDGCIGCSWKSMCNKSLFKALDLVDKTQSCPCAICVVKSMCTKCCDRWKYWVVRGGKDE